MTRQPTKKPLPQATNKQSKLNRLRSLSQILDNAIPIPGTPYRVGIDPLLGLFPAAGDYVSAAMSAYIVIEAAKLGASRATLSRMTLNIIIDALVGTVPVLGDLFDVAWKANAVNLELLEEHLRLSNTPTRRKKADWLFLGLLLAILLIFVTVVVGVGLLIVSSIWQAIMQ